MDVRIEVRGHNVFDRQMIVIEEMHNRFPLPTELQYQYAETFLRVPPPHNHLSDEDWPFDAMERAMNPDPVPESFNAWAARMERSVA
jgi:hypothetical protein